MKDGQAGCEHFERSSSLFRNNVLTSLLKRGNRALSFWKSHTRSGTDVDGGDGGRLPEAGL